MSKPLPGLDVPISTGTPVTQTWYEYFQGVRSDIAAMRERLTSHRTYYVRTDGSDSNTGLANTSGGAFLTLQKAWDTLVKLDVGDYNVGVQVADGTYTAGVICTNMPVGITGGTRVAFIGNTTTPANCLISVTGGNCVQVGDSTGITSRVYFDGFKFSTTTSGHCVEVNNSSAFKFGSNINFGACANAHFYCHTGGYVCESPPGYAISGSAQQHVLADMGGVVILHGITIDVSNSPVFSAFVVARGNAYIAIESNTWTNILTVTGLRAAAETGGVVVTGQTSTTYIPGNIGAQELTGGRVDYGVAWTTYTPTVTALIGTFTSASATGRYRLDGKTVVLQASATITTFGTGTFPQISLPSGFVTGFKFMGVAQRSTDAHLWGAEIGASSTNILLRDPTNSGTVASGDVFTVTITFEIN